MSEIRALERESVDARSAQQNKDAPSDATRKALFSDELKQNFFYCLKVFLGLRLALGLLALLATALLDPNVATSVPGWDAPVHTPGWHNFFSAWERWDALWFLRIAVGGYEDSDLSAAFFPLYPVLIRGLSTVFGGHPLAAALVISNLSFLGALVVLGELTREMFGTLMARRTVLYIALFPTAYFFLAPYTESLFLLLSAGAFLAARRQRWEWAGMCGALAAATRSIGLVLILPLAIEAWSQWQKRREPGGAPDRKLVVALSWSAFVAVGTLTYLFFWARFNGDPLTPLSDQNGWLREFSVPWASYLRGTQEAFRFVGQYAGGYHQVDWILVTVAIVAVVWLAKKVPAPYLVYASLSLLVPMSFVFDGRPFMSMPRFILPVFPIFWAFAFFAERFKAHDAVVAVSAAGLGVLTVLFVNWYFVF
jgi:hypothetical protein